MMKKRAKLTARGVGLFAFALGAVVVGGTGHADSILFEASVGEFVFDGDRILGLSASALFVLDETQLTVTLTNTSPYDVLVPSEVLTAVLFTINGSATLTMGTAMLTDYGLSGGSEIVFWDSLNPNADGTSADGSYVGDVGAEWAYNGNGIGSSGLDGAFGVGDRFDVARDLWNPDSLDGLQYGILPTADDLETGNYPVEGKEPMIVNSVTFTFTTSLGFLLSDISDVSFQYGTSQDQPNIPIPIPEPASMVLLGIGAAMAMLRQRNRRSR